MPFKKAFDQLNILSQCRKYRISLWQCPTFLFLVMGLVIITAALSVYFLGTRYVDSPEIVALIVLGLVVILFIMGFVITRSFERMAEASRMKSEFINIVSHQLRTPLANLNWAIELFMTGRLGQIAAKQMEYLTILKENSSRMRELISNLLTVSKIESATLSVKKEEIFLSDLIVKSINSLAPLAQASNVEIKFESQENLPKVFVDPSQIRLVVENLLGNAVRYIKNKGRVEISLGVRGNFLRCEITDNGVGIPKEDQKHIFQKFFRGESVLKYQTQGSGLGLFIAKSIIKRSGGKIGFKSQEGKGSTFWFTLPIKT